MFIYILERKKEREENVSLKPQNHVIYLINGQMRRYCSISFIEKLPLDGIFARVSFRIDWYDFIFANE